MRFAISSLKPAFGRVGVEEGNADVESAGIAGDEVGKAELANTEPVADELAGPEPFAKELADVEPVEEELAEVELAGGEVEEQSGETVGETKGAHGAAIPFPEPAKRTRASGLTRRPNGPARGDKTVGD